ncbi:MAG: hypothetical protein M1831_005581 [Alyxoria varia]|nr:MAG: hypothetical protein M1831_005581 [Alyxoria varia]
MDEMVVLSDTAVVAVTAGLVVLAAGVMVMMGLFGVVCVVPDEMKGDVVGVFMWVRWLFVEWWLWPLVGCEGVVDGVEGFDGDRGDGDDGDDGDDGGSNGSAPSTNHPSIFSPRSSPPSSPSSATSQPPSDAAIEYALNNAPESSSHLGSNSSSSNPSDTDLLTDPPGLSMGSSPISDDNNTTPVTAETNNSRATTISVSSWGMFQVPPNTQACTATSASNDRASSPVSSHYHHHHHIPAPPARSQHTPEPTQTMPATHVPWPWSVSETLEKGDGEDHEEEFVPLGGSANNLIDARERGDAVPVFSVDAEPCDAAGAATAAFCRYGPEWVVQPRRRCKGYVGERLDVGVNGESKRGSDGESEPIEPWDGAAATAAFYRYGPEWVVQPRRRCKGYVCGSADAHTDAVLDDASESGYEGEDEDENDPEDGDDTSNEGDELGYTTGIEYPRCTQNAWDGQGSFWEQDSVQDEHSSQHENEDDTFKEGDELESTTSDPRPLRICWTGRRRFWY